MGTLKLLNITLILAVSAVWVCPVEARNDFAISYEFGRQVINTDSDTVLSLITAKLIVPWDFLPKNPVVISTEVTPQLTFGYISKANSKIVGLELPFRFNFGKFSGLEPFADLGAGINYVEDKLEEIGGNFQFSLVGRLGIKWYSAVFPWKATELSFGIQHYSNGKIVDKPNSGLNYLTLRLGFIY